MAYATHHLLQIDRPGRPSALSGVALPLQQGRGSKALPRGIQVG